MFCHIEEFDSLQRMVSVYSGDIEHKGELVVDGTVLKTRPIKNRDCKSTINVTHKTYLLCDSEPSNSGLSKLMRVMALA